MKKILLSILLLTISLSLLACGSSNDGINSGSSAPVENSGDIAQPPDCPGTVEVADNSIDEDCDGWLATSRGFNLRAGRPRVLASPELFEEALSRMYGPQAREPWSRWFNLIKEAEDSGQQVDLVNLAILYRATGEERYLTAYINRFPGSGDPGRAELYSLDILWYHVPDSLKRSVRQRVHANPDIWYWNSVNQSQEEDVSWGYHSHNTVANALAYAGLFALTDMELNKDAGQEPFDALNYIALVQEELSDTGYFRQIERRIAGDASHNDALPGHCGGMYDNFGYDQSEESGSIFMLAQYYFLTGIDRYSGHLHDECRAQFYQHMSYPHLGRRYEQDAWCRQAGTEYHVLARIWNTQTDYVSQPRSDAVALTTWLYGDERMQYYFEQGTRRELCGAPYNEMYRDLLFYTDEVTAQGPENDATARYFNGPGLVSMRSDWSNEAAFGVFIAGEGISRRYEDAASFLIHRKVDVFPHAGARIRNNDDNGAHHWYHMRSASKNTMKVFDPEEHFSVDANSERGDFHSGPPLVASDNLGGQIFEMGISEQDMVFRAWNTSTPYRRTNHDHPLGLYETANITKFEHQEGDWTYSVADATAAYTRKVDFFEREFLFLRPSTFIIFDRLQARDASFRKEWTVHTVDRPQTACSPGASGQGMRAWDNCRTLLISNPDNVTHIDALLPASNRITVRGGDTVLGEGPVSRGSSLTVSNLEEVEIPRWLELFAVGSDVQGSLTIQGDARQGSGVSEVVTFDGRNQYEVDKRFSGTISGGLLTDPEEQWQADQFKDFMLELRCGSGNQQGRIVSNTENSIQAELAGCSAWGYRIYRPLANSYNHWQRISSISTTDMSIDKLTVSVPHYFDTEDASGRLLSFAPHTDSRHDSYRKRKDLGQYTISIAATTPQRLDSFVNVIQLLDPGVAKADTAGFENDQVAGAVIGQRFVLFAKDRGNLTEFRVDLGRAANHGLICNLLPNQAYYVSLSGSRLAVSLADNGGRLATSSAMGVVEVVE